MRPLDYDMWNKILFKNHLVFDFLTDELRAARPEDRLLRTTNRDYVDWGAPQSLKDMIAQFALHLKAFFVGGGENFDPLIDDDDERSDETDAVKADRTECLRLFKLIKAAPESGMLKALANVICDDDTDLNEIVFVLRTDARILASMEKMVGMVAYTGPRNGGKSFINMRLVHFLGDHPDRLAKQVGGKYLSSTLREDAQASQPVTATFRGKKLISFKEFSESPIQPETLKNILDPQDGNVDARHNNNKLGELTAFPITFVLSGCGNQAITLHSTPGKDNGCGGKIHEIRTNYNLSRAPMSLIRPSGSATRPHPRGVAKASTMVSCSSGHA